MLNRSLHEFQRQTRLSSWPAFEDVELDVAAVEGAGVLPLELELDDWAPASWVVEDMLKRETGIRGAGVVPKPKCQTRSGSRVEGGPWVGEEQGRQLVWRVGLVQPKGIGCSEVYFCRGFLPDGFLNLFPEQETQKTARNRVWKNVGSQDA